MTNEYLGYQTMDYINKKELTERKYIESIMPQNDDSET